MLGLGIGGQAVAVLAGGDDDFKAAAEIMTARARIW